MNRNPVPEVSGVDEPPITWYFVPCLRADVSPDGRHVSLIDVVHTIYPAAGGTFPCVRDEMTFFAVLTNGRGRHVLDIEITRFDLGQDMPVGASPPIPVDMGTDPTAIRGLPIPARNVEFKVPGQYTFRLRCNGQPIAEARVMVREQR